MARKKRRTKRRPAARRKVAKRTARATAPSPRRRTKRRKSAAESTIRGVLLGHVASVTYKHAQGGGTYRHTFKAGTPIAYTPDRKFLIIPANVAAFIR